MKWKWTVNWVRNEGNETNLWHFDFSTVKAARLCFHRKIDMKIVCFSNALGKHHQDVLPYMSIQIYKITKGKAIVLQNDQTTATQMSITVTIRLH